MATENQTRDVSQAFEELESARVSYEDANVNARQASLRETEALNRLNDAQKRFDGLVESIRDQHPHRSDWKTRLRRGEAA